MIGEKLPAEEDGLFLEVVTEREITQHLKKGVVSGSTPHIAQVVMLASGAHALLGRGGSHVIPLFFAQEWSFELDHTSGGEKQGGIVMGDQRGTLYYGMLVGLEVFKEGSSQFGSFHSSVDSSSPLSDSFRP
jgi:hypothetical protein